MLPVNLFTAHLFLSKQTYPIHKHVFIYVKPSIGVSCPYSVTPNIFISDLTWLLFSAALIPKVFFFTSHFDIDF